MLDTFVEDLKGFLMKPGDAFKKAKGASLGAAYQYYFVLLIIFSILFGIVTVSVGIASFTQMVNMIATLPWIGGLISAAMAKFSAFVVAWEVFTVYLMFVAMLFSVFLGGLLLHVFVLLVGGEKGVVQTIKTNMYAATPFLLLGWIPYISIIGVIWSFILLILGLEQTQEISIGKALMVVLIPIVLGIILAALGAVVIETFFTALFSLFPGLF
jgi:hypothetical protein